MVALVVPTREDHAESAKAKKRQATNSHQPLEKEHAVSRLADVSSDRLGAATARKIHVAIASDELILSSTFSI